MIVQPSKITALMLVVFMLPHCGAPTKSAGEVANIFQSSKTLGDKVNELCDLLRTSKSSPNLDGINLDSSGCKLAGRDAQNVTGLTEVQFAGFDESSIKSTNDQSIYRMEVRGQLWLNKNLLGLVAIATSKMNASGGGKLEPGKALPMPKQAAASSGAKDSNPAAGMEGFVQQELILNSEPKFDMENKTFNMDLTVKASGGAKINNQILVAGRMVEQGILVSIESKGTTKYEDSLLNKIKAVIIVVPHAGDIYVDLNMNLELHSLGVDGAYSKVVKQMLTGTAKMVVDSVSSLEK